MIVKSVSYERRGSSCRCEAAVRCESAVQTDFTVRFDIHADIAPPDPAGDPWLAALLAPAMFTGEELVINAPLSKGLLTRARDAQTMLRAWFPQVLREVPMRGSSIVENGSSPRRATACFFSGGVDSWYSFLKHQEEVSALITVKGFDIPCTDQATWPELVSANRAIAAELGRDLILVETDIRDRLDPNYKLFTRMPATTDFWGECMHGPCMAAVGLMLGSRMSRVIIPGSMEYSFLPPWGSHPLLDPLWSNDQVSFVHDGCEHLRLEKLRAIAKSDLVLRYLRVCPAYTPGRYNCCACEKCKRTMMTLRLFGVLDRGTCFDRPLDLESMELLPLAPIYFPTYREILGEARRVGDHEIERLVSILVREKRSARREWHKWKTKASRILPRWKRSIRKRLG